MKKIIASVSLLLLIISLISCGKGTDTTEDTLTTEASGKEASVLEDTESIAVADSTSTEATVTDATVTDAIAGVASANDADEKDTATLINPKSDILISIDPGHQSERVDMSATEPNAPGSSVMKMKATGGTMGRFTGVPEYQLNLDISLQLRDRLEEEGYNVIMTREDNDTAISNMERAQMANEAGADISIRIHANGSEDSGVSGALSMVGSASNPYVGSLYQDSYALAKSVLEEYCKSTGMNNQGVVETDTMTGINWSQIPVMILEMGYMTNQTDDNNMQDPEYQKNMVDGIVTGINKYFGLEDGYYTISVEESSDGDSYKVEDNEKDITDSELGKAVNLLLEHEREGGAVCSVYAKNLKTGEFINLSTATHRSASIIKLYIAGTVYENMDRLVRAGNSESDIEEKVKNMITISDNDSANELVRMLGLSDAEKGMEYVNEYISSLGYTESSMGRLMLDFASEHENYVEVTEIGDYLGKLYNGEVKGADKIVQYMKQQERLSKIPSGVPDVAVVANKTGELEDVEHDVAIIYGEDADYILCVLLSQLSSNQSGVETISSISGLIYDEWK